MKLSIQAAHALPYRQTLADGKRENAPTIKDHVVPGLMLVANKSTKTWLFYYRTAAGEQRKPKLGDFPVMGIEAARLRAKEVQEAVWRGEDPSADRRASRAAPTVAELAELYLESRTTKPRTVDENRRHIRLHILPALGRMRVADVTRDHVNKMLKRIGSVYANRVRDTVSGMFRLAEDPDYQWRPVNSNPTRGERAYIVPERKRYRHATAAECQALSLELARLRDVWPARVAALLVILFAGTRVTELVTAKKEQMRGNVLILQEHKTERTGEDRVIVMPRQAVEILENLHDDGSGYLFGAKLAKIDDQGVPRGRYMIFRCWEIAREAAGCPDLQVLDLRRTFASAAKSRGVDLGTIGKIFGHKDPETTDRYAWLFDDVHQRVVQDTADAIEQRMLPSPQPGE